MSEMVKMSLICSLRKVKSYLCFFKFSVVIQFQSNFSVPAAGVNHVHAEGRNLFSLQSLLVCLFPTRLQITSFLGTPPKPEE